jgi:hypothetical protein
VDFSGNSGIGMGRRSCARRMRVNVEFPLVWKIGRRWLFQRM